MDSAPFALEHQRCISLALIHIAYAEAIGCVLVMTRPREYKRHIAVVVAVKHICVFRECLPTACIDTDFIQWHIHHARMGMMRVLSAYAALVEYFCRRLKHIVTAEISHTRHRRQLTHTRHVDKAVVVAVMSRKSVFEMCEEPATPVASEMEISVGVQFKFVHHVVVTIYRQRRIELWLFHLHVDLSGYRLIAVLYRRCTFRHLYRLHPRTRDIAEAVGRRRSAEVWYILSKHLHIRARQPQQTYLPGACGGVGIVDVDRRIGGEALAEIAACRTLKLRSGDKF